MRTGGVHRLTRVQVVPHDLASVFRFFKSPRNLEEITPPWLAFRILSASDTDVREGTRIVYRLRWWIFPLRWESRITEYEEGRHFADAMVRGPYRRWYHRHLFRAVPEGVEIRDEVEYALPFGPFGRMAHRLTVRRQLDAIFAFRQRRIAELFGGAGTPEVTIHAPA